MIEGFVFIPRKIIGSSLWKQNATKLKLYLYLLLMSNHKDNGKFNKDEHVTSYEQISKHTGMNRNTISKCLTWLRKNKYISLLPAKGTRIKINYNHYMFNDSTADAEYQKYLKSTHWKEFRQTVLAYFNNMCAICGSSKDLNVHHLNYNCLWNEQISDVIVLCQECHRKEHNLD